MRVKGIIISLLVIAVLAVALATAQAGYEGKAKIVLKISQMPATPTPMAMGIGSTNAFGEDASLAAFQLPQAPDVPQGTVLQADVLYSSDPALKAGDKCSLYINYDTGNVPQGMKASLLDKLLPGAIVGVNDYTLKGSQVVVAVGSSPLWAQKVFIVDASNTQPGASKNPFKIDLNIFKSFGDFVPPYPGNITATPEPSAWPKPSLWPTPSTFPVLGNGLGNMFANIFG